MSFSNTAPWSYARLSPAYSDVFRMRTVVPAAIVDLQDLHHGSETGQAVVCIAGGFPVPEVEWYICKNIKQ